MTIEPMMVLQGIASNIVTVPEDQMVLYKICRGIFSVIHISIPYNYVLCIFTEEQFDLPVEFCENIEDYRNTTDYDDVENEVDIELN